MRRQAARRQDPYGLRAPAGDQQPESRDPAAELFGQAVTVSDISGDDIPRGWNVDEEGCFQLGITNYHDYWEVRAGCLVRHHLQPRHRSYDITKSKDCPFELKQLDIAGPCQPNVTNSIRQITTDRYDTVSCLDWHDDLPDQWCHTQRAGHVLPAKKVARQAKHAAIKKKPASELNERGLTVLEREQFMQAKIKELRSFFENGVWEFRPREGHRPGENTDLKDALNADGSPRAKARLVVMQCT